MDALPDADGVHEHVAELLETVTETHPVMFVPPFLKVTVPVAPVVTLAVMLYAVPARGDAGRVPSVTVDDFHGAVPDAVAAGRLGAAESTGVTRTS